MGEDNLKAFISNYKNDIIDFISIGHEVASWKRNHNGSAPVILVDLNECLGMLVLQDQIGVILGGHYDRYNNMMRQFLKNIHDTGAKLVFFVPGRQQSDDLPFFIPKTEERYIESIEILDKMEEKADLKGFLQESNRLRTNERMELAFNNNLKKLVSDFGDFRVTYEQHNQEIARYAKQNASKILALITDDVEFMAFSGTYEFWRAKSINFIKLTCDRYNTDRLYKKLGFDHGAVQLQLLNALSGSIFLPTFVLADFLNRLTNANRTSHKRGIIWNVAAYVKRQPLTVVDNKMTHDLEQVSRDVFGADFSREELNAIANGLAHYDLDYAEPMKANLNAFRHRCKSQYPFIYKLVTEKTFNVHDISYMDYRNCKSTSYPELVIPILVKMYGILFKDYPRRPKTRKICMKHAHDEPSKVTDEVIMYPTMELPNLYDLVFDTRKRHFDQARWSLLEWILNLNDGAVKKIQRQKNYHHYAAVVITLLYLVKQRELTSEEAHIILYTEYQIQNDRRSKIQYPGHPNAHYVRIAHLYVKIFVLVSHCLDICGLHHMTDLLRFDGAMFHRNMKNCEEETKLLDSKIESAIQGIWMFS